MAIEWDKLKDLIQDSLNVTDYDYQAALDLLKINPFSGSLSVDSALESGIQFVLCNAILQ